MGIRPQKIAKSIKRYVSKIIQEELKDPRIGFVTITDVEITKDLKYARVYYSILGDKTERNNTINALKSAGGYIKKLVGRNLGIRYIPEIIFVEDKAAERAGNIYRILDNIKEKKASKEG